MDQEIITIINKVLDTAMQPAKPAALDGTFDYHKLNTWLHQLGQNFSIVQTTFRTEIMDDNKVVFASTLLKINTKI